VSAWHVLDVLRTHRNTPRIRPKGRTEPPRKLTTHSAFFVTPDRRDAEVTETVDGFQRRGDLIAGSCGQVPVITNQARMVRTCHDR
jgi:hypothetical protein